MQTIIDNNVYYWPSVLDYDSCVTLWNNIVNTCDLRYYNVIIAGREVKQGRSTCYYGDVDFKYSGITMPACPMPDFISDIMYKLNYALNISCNSCLINMYRNGKEYISHHSDGKGYSMGSNNAVVTLSLGGTRTFQLRGKYNGEVINLLLNNGDVVLMMNRTQELTTHSIIKDSSNNPRISLTFRHLL